MSSFSQISKFSGNLEIWRSIHFSEKNPTNFDQIWAEQLQNCFKKWFFCEQKINKNFDEFLLKYWGLGGAKACEACRSRRELPNEYLGFTCKIWLRCSRERAFGNLEFGREFGNLDGRKFLFQFPNYRGNWEFELRGQGTGRRGGPGSRTALSRGRPPARTPTWRRSRACGPRRAASPGRAPSTWFPGNARGASKPCFRSDF